MPKVTAVLIDTVSIQKYVFAGNKLRENIGASRNVSLIYQEPLQKAVKDVLGQPVSLEAWLEKPEDVALMEPNAEANFEVGYVGGGNALLFFREQKHAETFVELWTKRLLIEFPGIQVAVAIDSDFDMDNFKASLQKLFIILRDNKNRYLTQTTLPKHGITADCPLSGLSAEVSDSISDNKPVSSVVHAKLQSAVDSKLDDAEATWLDPAVRKNYVFTDQIDALGQIEGNSHIAIVHIDGNSMGEQFKNCQTLQEIRSLSKKVKGYVDSAFKKMLQHLIEQETLLSENGFKVHKSGEKLVLRVRPILIEGDDITFIADGRIGVYLAEKYLQFLEEASHHEMTACAGVAITKTKYPFYRGYQLAEELCSCAKKEARKKPNTSWLDFHLAYGGFSGQLATVRQERYSTRDGLLLFGPYLVTAVKNHPKNIAYLREGIKRLNDREEWPRNKVKGLRTALTLGKDASEKYIAENIEAGKLPVIPGGNYDKQAFDHGATPYYEMIELSEFYPVGLITSERWA
ncbi:MAG TPA: hypothetical protein DF292_04730 [Firmicutes bacterium]|jgi:hypothetical protein|nr:hypothetical protein [Bacillota bacterium]